jgi:hypothetical protein
MRKNSEFDSVSVLSQTTIGVSKPARFASKTDDKPDLTHLSGGFSVARPIDQGTLERCLYQFLFTRESE